MVSKGLSGVLPSVELDDQAMASAGEIHDEGPDRHLAAELAAIQLSVSQPGPEQAFGIGLVYAKITRPPDGQRRCRCSHESLHKRIWRDLADLNWERVLVLPHLVFLCAYRR